MNISKCAIIFAMTSALSFAESWSGTLVDAACKARNEGNSSGVKAECVATSATTSFALQTSDGKVFNLDAAGNTKAAAAIKSSTKTNGKATVTGSLDGNTVKVESIQIDE